MTNRIVAVAEKSEPATIRRNEEVQARMLDSSPEKDAARHSPVQPFLIGTIIGGIAGAILGTALSPHTRGLLMGFYHLVNRRVAASERDQLRFELLLQ